MFTKLYLTAVIVLRCYKKYSNFLWYFYGNSPEIICSQFVFKTKIMCICFCGVLFKCVLLWWPENTLRKHSWFFFALEKIKCMSNLAASYDLAVTSRRMIMYTGNQTFPMAKMSAFRTKRCMQHIPSLFWFLLTILSIRSLTAFPLISIGSQISVTLRCPIISALLLNAAFMRNLSIM